MVLQSFLMSLSSQLLNVQAEWGAGIMLALRGKVEADMVLGLRQYLVGLGIIGSSPSKGKTKPPS